MANFGLPSVPPGLDPALAEFLSKLKDQVEVREGQRRNTELSRFVTVGDLAEAGLYDKKKKAFISGGGDKTPPAPPTNLFGVNRGRTILITWDNPKDEDLSHVEIWRAESSANIDAAVQVGSIPQPQHAFEDAGIKITESYRYWARAVDTSDNKSVWASTAGTPVEPNVDGSNQELYDSFFGDLSKNPAVLRINEKINAVGGVFDPKNGSYVTGDVVLSGGKIFKATRDNPAPAKDVTDTGYWQEYTDLASGIVQNDARVIQAEGQIALRATKAELEGVQQVVDMNTSKLSLVPDKISAQVDRQHWDLPTGKYFQVSSLVEQAASSWTVKIQSDGTGRKAVTGIDLMLGADFESQFLVMADKFLVTTPGGSPKGVFAVGADGAYLAPHLFAAGGITSSMLAVGASLQNIQPGTIGTTYIQNGAITTDKITAGAVDAARIAAGAIDASKIQAGAITADKIAANSISADKLQAGSITADKIAADTIDARVLKQNGIPIDKIFSGVIKEINFGSTNCSLSQPGGHLYLVFAEVWGAGTITFNCSHSGSRTYELPGIVPVGESGSRFPHAVFSTCFYAYSWGPSNCSISSPTNGGMTNTAIVGVSVKGNGG